MRFDKLVVPGIICLVVGVAALSIWAAIEESKQWQEFAIQHDCKVTQKIKATTSTGYGYGLMANGQMGTGMITTTTAAKTAYLCDDGVTYWR